MLQLEDKITIALAGPIKSGKSILAEKAKEYQNVLYQSLQGNFWVPKKLTVIEEHLDNDLFEKYSTDPQRYAFEFQCMCMANRLAQQDQVDISTGIVLLDQPLEIDRHIYAEANKISLEGSFRTYERLNAEVKKRVTSPDIWIYLRVPEEKIAIILERIERYGREGEKKFLADSSYLIQNIRLNEKFFASVRQPVITIDATNPVFSGENNEEQLQSIYASIAKEVSQFKSPPRLTLDEWEAVDYNRAQNGAREARRQLRKYLAEHPTIITLAGPVGAGKTGMAELIHEELDVGIHRELDGKNDVIADDLLGKFLCDKKTYGYDLQKCLLPKRTGARTEKYELGDSFVEDRSPVEDQSIFWRRLHRQGYLSDEQMEELQGLAKETYAKAPKSDVMIKLLRSPRECRKMVLARGRPQEVMAWPLQELEQMQLLYEDLFEDMEQYGSHQGPKIGLNLAEFNPKNTIHQGYLWQEVLHSLIEK